MRIWFLFISAVLAIGAQAQDFPNRTIRLVVPFSPGGSTDGISRHLAQKLTVALGQPMVVENRPGAGGTLGTDLVAKSKPDGYTLLFVATSTAINQALFTNLPYDTMKDLDPVIHLVNLSGILVVHPDLPVRTVPELIALARAKPGSLNYASAGNGTTLHLAAEMFNALAKTEITHVPYKGSGPALTDLIGGRVQMMFANMPGTVQHVRAGRIRVIAVTDEKRSPVFPEVPTVAESGVPGYRATGWFGIMAPAGTPREIVERLNAELNKALRTPELTEFMRNEGAELAGGTPQDFRAHLRSEVDRWGAVIKSAGIKAN
jgi:tripartite-type tricarboxylate transporter receptor subunit TctC